MKGVSVKSMAVGVLLSYAATEAAMWILDKYVEHIIVKGSERSPFDMWVIRTFATPTEKEAVNHIGATPEGVLALQGGANVREVTDIYQSLPLSVVSNVAPINVWRVCSVESSKVCLLMPPEGSIIFIAEVQEPDQKCITTMSYGNKRVSLGETFISNNTLSVYTLRTKAGRKMADVVRYSTEFSVTYTCEFGSYGSYGFKLSHPLGDKQ